MLVTAAGLLLLPARWAPLPLLVGACYMTLGEGIEIGSLSFPVIRILIAAGLVRVLLRGERLAGPFNALDGLMLAWAAWAVFSSVFHTNVAATLENRLGLIYNACGVYFLLRVLCRSTEDVLRLCRTIALLMIPLSLEMLYERMSGGHNLFSALGGVDAMSAVRDGQVRAQGPFAHAILAGSVGAGCLPLMAAIWQRYRVVAKAGFAACLLMVWTSASSGPYLSTLLAIVALAMWPLRHHMRTLRWLAVLGYVALDLVMNAPAYFVLARLDVTGSSTSWHRAELIRTAIRHLPEWWLGGTDYTRHWMAYGVGWSGNHIDITNYYINMGVNGGLPLMLLFIGILAKGFSFVGRRTSSEPTAGLLPRLLDPLPTLPDAKLMESKRSEEATSAQRAACFAAWALGASLFAHAATFLAVSYFDQSVVFLYVTLAAICASVPGTVSAAEPSGSTELEPTPTLSPLEGQPATPHQGLLPR